MKTYGALSLTASSPAQVLAEPLTVGEAQHYLHLPPRNPQIVEETNLLETLIIAAREQAEILQGRDLVRKQWDMALDYFPPFCDGRALVYDDLDEIELRHPLVSVDLVRYKDSAGALTTLVENTDYIVDTARSLIKPVYGQQWPSFTPWPTSAVLIRFTSGYALDDLYWSDSGQRVLTGMQMLISLWFNERLPRQVTQEGSGDWLIDRLLSYGGIRKVR